VVGCIVGPLVDSAVGHKLGAPNCNSLGLADGKLLGTEVTASSVSGVCHSN
jgi:hypothetical protein